MSAGIERAGKVFAVRRSSLTNWKSWLAVLLLEVSQPLLNACVSRQANGIDPSQPFALTPKTGLREKSSISATCTYAIASTSRIAAYTAVTSAQAFPRYVMRHTGTCRYCVPNSRHRQGSISYPPLSTGVQIRCPVFS